jgi:hypothetical protein
MKTSIACLTLSLVTFSAFSQIKCDHLNCTNQSSPILTLETDELGNELLSISDPENSIPMMDVNGEDSLIMNADGTFNVVYAVQNNPYSGCVKACSAEPFNNCISYISYENGVKHGPELQFFETGELNFKGEFLHGVPVGEHIYYAAPSVLQSKINYDQTGKKHGLEEIYEGKSILVNQYNHGILVSASKKK